MRASNLILNYWVDIYSMRRFFLDKYQVANKNNFIYSRRPSRINVIIKIIKKIKYIRRSYAGIISSSNIVGEFSWLIHKAYKGNLAYNRGILIWLIENYIFFKINKLYDFNSKYDAGLMYWINSLYNYLIYYSIKFNIIYLPITKVYLHGLLNMWCNINIKGNMINKLTDIRLSYVWSWVDVPISNELDYFGGNSVVIYKNWYSWYSYIYILFFIKWSFMSIYNWKHFY